MDGTVLSQGTFTVAAGVPLKVIEIPSNADFMWVRNFTQSGAAGSTAPAIGFNFYWQRGMAAGSAILQYKTNALLTDNTDTITVGGFTLYDPSGVSSGSQPLVGPAVATTAATNATRPVVSTASTNGVYVGAIVQKYDAQNNIDSIPMEVSAVTLNTNFTMLSATNALQAAPGVIGGAGTYRIVQYPLFYPRRLYITNITGTSGNLTVATSVQHGLTPGQRIRFTIPSQSGSVELNSNSFNNYQSFVIQSVGAAGDTFVVVAPTGGITAFTFPTIAQVAAGSQYPIVVPFGEDTASSLSIAGAQVPTILGNPVFAAQSGILADATVNTGFLGMVLGTGGTALALNAAVTGPAGTTAGDVVYWVAGKSAFGGL